MVFQCGRELHGCETVHIIDRNDVQSSTVMQISPALKVYGIWARIVGPSNWASHCMGRDLRTSWMHIADYLATASSMCNLHIVLILTPKKSSQTDQFDTRWCVGWRDKNYRQITIELTVVEIISSLHLTSRLLSAWSRQFRCSARFECLYNSFPHTICFQWRRALSMHQNLSQHLCSERFPSCISSLNYM